MCATGISSSDTYAVTSDSRVVFVHERLCSSGIAIPIELPPCMLSSGPAPTEEGCHMLAFGADSATSTPASTLQPIDVDRARGCLIRPNAPPSTHSRLTWKRASHGSASGRRTENPLHLRRTCRGGSVFPHNRRDRCSLRTNKSNCCTPIPSLPGSCRPQHQLR